MNYYIKRDDIAVETTDSEERAYRIADSWQEIYPDADIRILVELER